MLAAPDDLDDLMRGGELARLGDGGDGLLHRRRGILVDAAAGLADQEGDHIARAMAVQAGDMTLYPTWDIGWLSCSPASASTATPPASAASAAARSPSKHASWRLVQFTGSSAVVLGDVFYS